MDMKINLLVVDDEQIILDSIKKLLKHEDIYSISTVTSGKEALEFLKTNNVDIMLTDLMMPEMDGLELMKCLGEMGFKGVIIMLTGYATINSALQAMELGAFDYLAKPFTKNEIKRILNRARDLITAKKSNAENQTSTYYGEKSIIDSQSSTGKYTWFMTTEDDLIMLGVERPFLIEIGSIESVYLPEEGDEIRQGSNFFQIFSSDFRTFTLTSPFSGIVKEVNNFVLSEPNRALEDPYNSGWLIKLEAKKFNEELATLSLKY